MAAIIVSSEGPAPVQEDDIVPDKKQKGPIFVPKFTEDRCCLSQTTPEEFLQLMQHHRRTNCSDDDDYNNDDDDVRAHDLLGVIQNYEKCEYVSNTFSKPNNTLEEVTEELIIPIVLKKNKKLECQYSSQNSLIENKPAKNLTLVEEHDFDEAGLTTMATPSGTVSMGSITESKKSSKQRKLKVKSITSYFKKKNTGSSKDKPNKHNDAASETSSDKRELDKQNFNVQLFFKRMSFGKGKNNKSKCTSNSENKFSLSFDHKSEPEVKNLDPEKTLHNTEHGEEACSGKVADFKSSLVFPNNETIKRKKQEADLPADPESDWSNMTAHYAVGHYIDSQRVDKSSQLQNTVVVAIDFGTAFSGYAYSFLDDPEHIIHMMGKWENGDPGVINQKTPTTLLLTPDGKFNSFGFTARNNYQDLSFEEATEWMLFDHFKMSLYKANSCNMNTTIEAVNGKKFSAFQAISMTLQFFKTHAIKELSNQTGSQFTNDDILWVLTVPAIWSSPAKQFMRLAAYQAGLANPDKANKLIVALEPEAAAIHICRLRKHQFVPEKPVLFDFYKFKAIRETVVEPKLIEEFKKKSRYIILDCGGGTVDITVHEMDAETGLIQELQAASGGPYGASNIDVEFRLLLCKIFGKDFMNSFQLNCPNGWISLMMFFESRKRAADPMKPSSLNIALPFSFLEHFRKTQASTVDKAIKNYGDPEIQWSPQGMLKLSQQSMQKLFEPCTDKIGRCIFNIIKTVKGIQYIFMVGGLSESPLLQREIRNLCTDLCDSSVKVIIPQEASLAVVKGAVSFGIHPEVLAARRSRLTYGAAVLNTFQPSKHPQSKLILKEDKTWCKDIFDVFVRAEELINCGHVVERSYVTADPKQLKMIVGIYCSTSQHPIYVTDADVTKCANICLHLDLPTEEITQRFIRVRMEFAATEIKVTAVDAASGQHVDSRIDFLNL